MTNQSDRLQAIQILALPTNWDRERLGSDLCFISGGCSIAENVARRDVRGPIMLEQNVTSLPLQFSSPPSHSMPVNAVLGFARVDGLITPFRQAAEPARSFPHSISMRRRVVHYCV